MTVLTQKWFGYSLHSHFYTHPRQPPSMSLLRHKAKGYFGIFLSPATEYTHILRNKDDICGNTEKNTFTIIQNSSSLNFWPMWPNCLPVLAVEPIEP